MNPGLWLLKKAKWELLIVFSVIVTLLLLPILVVAVVAATGNSVVSKTLASINPVTHLVEIFDSKGQKVTELSLSTVWPTSGYITDEFGTKESFRANLGLGKHTGIDIASKDGSIGAPITPFMTGTVSRIDNIDDSACGISVLISHEHNISSLYCHLSKTSAIQGAVVNPGDIIGYMGSTGTSTGAHLHFQVMIYGIPVNPRTFMVGVPESVNAN